MVGEMRNAHEVLNRKHERKRPLRRPRHIWNDIVTCYLLPRRIIMWVTDFLSRFIGSYIRRSYNHLITLLITLTIPNSCGELLSRTVKDEFLIQTFSADSPDQTSSPTAAITNA
jgi:hypothetical protein